MTTFRRLINSLLSELFVVSLLLATVGLLLAGCKVDNGPRPSECSIKEDGVFCKSTG